MTLLKCILVLVLAVGCAEARKKKNRCSKDHALVGKRGNLITKSHDVSIAEAWLGKCIGIGAKSPIGRFSSMEELAALSGNVVVFQWQH